jgi:hypothetical protein
MENISQKLIYIYMLNNFHIKNMKWTQHNICYIYDGWLHLQWMSSCQFHFIFLLWKSIQDAIRKLYDDLIYRIYLNFRKV